MTDTQREAFEAAIEAHGRLRPFLRWPGDGSYTDDRLEWAWRGYQAALAQAGEVPDGYVLMPATPSDDMLIAILSEGESQAMTRCKCAYERNVLLRMAGAYGRYEAMLAAALELQPGASEAQEMSRYSRAMLLNILWHHQGSSSAVGQPIRALLGIGTHAHLTDEQIAESKWIGGLLASPQPSPAPALYKSYGGHCAEGDKCVCGGDLSRVRAGCANWRTPAEQPSARVALSDEQKRALLIAATNGYLSERERACIRDILAASAAQGEP